MPIDPASEAFPASLREAISKLEPYFTPATDFRDVSRGKPIPHTLDDEQKKAAGLTRETWKLEVISDPEHPAKIRRPVTLTFDELLELGSKQAVRFPKVMTCLNIGCIPSKALLDSSEHYWQAQHALGEHGVKLGGVTLDLPAMMARKDKVVRGLTQGVRGLVKKIGRAHV